MGRAASLVLGLVTGLTGLLVGSLLGLYLSIPTIVEGVASRAAMRVADRLDREIRVGSFEFHRYDRLVMRDVALVPAGDGDPSPLLWADSIDLVVDADRIWSGKVRIESIAIDGAHAESTRAEDGSDNFGDVRDRVRALLERREDHGSVDEGEGSTALRFLDRAIPDLRVSNASIRYTDPRLADLLGGERTFELFEGSMEVSDASRVRERVDLHMSGSARVAPVDTAVEVVARLERPDGGVELDIALTRPLVVPLGDRTATVGGVRWELDGGLELTNVSLSAPSVAGAEARDAIRIGSVAFDLAPLADNAESGGSRIAQFVSRIQQVRIVAPDLVIARDAAGRTNFADVVERVTRALGHAEPAPEVEIEALPEPDDEAEVADKNVPAAQIADSERVRRALARLFALVERKTVRLADVVFAVGSTLPIDDVVIERGVVRYEDEGVHPEGFREQLHGFSMRAQRHPDQRLMTYDVSFLRGGEPTGGVGKGAANTLEARVQLDTRDVQLEMSAQDFELWPYRALVPPPFLVTEDTRLHDTRLSLIYSDSRGEARVEGELHWTDLTVVEPKIAPEPMTGIRGGVEFAARLDLDSHAVQVTEATLRIGDAKIVLTGSIEAATVAPRIELHARLPRTRLQTLFDALPAALVPILEGMSLRGELEWELDLALDTSDLDGLEYDARPTWHGARVDSMGRHVRFDVLRGPFEHEVTEPDGSMVRFITGPGAPHWIRYDQLSPWMTAVVTTTEDGRFFRHEGFSTFAIRESIVTNLKKARFARGASTITQQLAKNLYLARDKTISRKLQEVLITWQLERRVTKTDLLELYFNIIEFGPGIYGIRKAADYYFGKHPAELTLLDCVFLGSLIPNPKRYHHQFARGGCTDGWRAKLRYFARAMRDRGKITEEQYEALAPYSPRFVTADGKTIRDVAPDGAIVDNPVRAGDELFIVPDSLSEEELEGEDAFAFDPAIAP